MTYVPTYDPTHAPPDYNLLDSNADASISETEWRAYASSLGVPAEEQGMWLAMSIWPADTNGDRLISYEEFFIMRSTPSPTYDPTYAPTYDPTYAPTYAPTESQADPPTEPPTHRARRRCCRRRHKKKRSLQYRETGQSHKSR